MSVDFVYGDCAGISTIVNTMISVEISNWISVSMLYIICTAYTVDYNWLRYWSIVFNRRPKEEWKLCFSCPMHAQLVCPVCNLYASWQIIDVKCILNMHMRHCKHTSRVILCDSNQLDENKEVKPLPNHRLLTSPHRIDSLLCLCASVCKFGVVKC